MNILRAIWAGILLWLLIFIEASILMFGFGLQQGTAGYYLTHFILLILFTVMLSLYYFFRRSRGRILEGLGLGIVFIIVLIILDSLITIPLIIKDYNFLLRSDILIGELVILIVSAIVGAVKS